MIHTIIVVFIVVFLIALFARVLYTCFFLLLAGGCFSIAYAYFVSGNTLIMILPIVIGAWFIELAVKD